MNIFAPAFQQPLGHQHGARPLQIAKAIREFLASFETGVAAWQDYARLDRMSDNQLASSGLSRENLPRHIFGKHFT